MFLTVFNKNKLITEIKMKVIGIIAEYNPFHLGHLKQIEYVKNTLGADKIIVIMSGNFTQRGEPAVMNKFMRAKHAVLGGADAVIELPTVFSNSNAETFAKGAIKILNDLKIVDGICFGVESGKEEEYLTLANALINESDEYKKALKENLVSGVSLAKAKYQALTSLTEGTLNQNLMSSPNNILGLEYTKAILSLNPTLKIYPFLRSGNHNEIKLTKSITSAKSIREAVRRGEKRKVKKYLPKVVYRDICTYPSFDDVILSNLLRASPEKLKEIPDCTEGLENRIKTSARVNNDLSDLIKDVSTKRYTEARIRRILIGNLLNVTKEITASALTEKLYAKVLAIKQGDLLKKLSNADIPLLTRKSDAIKLSDTSRKVFDIDVLANEIFNLVNKEHENENQTLFI